MKECLQIFMFLDVKVGVQANRRKLKYHVCLFFVFWVFFFFCPLSFQGLTCGIWKFPGQGSNPSSSCHLCHSHSHSHSHTGSEQHLQPTAQLRAMRILNPLSEARDQTRNVMVPSGIRFRLPTAGTPKVVFLIKEVDIENGSSSQRKSLCFLQCIWGSLPLKIALLLLLLSLQ